MRKVLENYYKACDEVLKDFAGNYEYHEYRWIADKVGELAELADIHEYYVFDMPTMLTALETGVRTGDLERWYAYSIAALSMNKTVPNLSLYIKGCPVDEEVKKAVDRYYDGVNN